MLKHNMKYTLTIKGWQSPNEDSEEIYIGSEIKPVKIGRTDIYYKDHEIQRYKEFWVVVQKGKALLIMVLREDVGPYAYDLVKSPVYLVYDLPPILKEIVGLLATPDFYIEREQTGGDE